MIIGAEIINQPVSDQYLEKVYDVLNPWNSGEWTWIKFLNEDFSEWCGEFRGGAKGVAISKIHNAVLVLTSDSLYKLSRISEELIEYESQTEYQNLTVTPKGDFILSDYYHIFTLDSTLKKEMILESPIEMDYIKFHNWSNNKLLITCDWFCNWDKRAELELDGETLEIEIKKVI
jgi:hypothetical protein